MRLTQLSEWIGLDDDFVMKLMAPSKRYCLGPVCRI